MELLQSYASDDNVSINSDKELNQRAVTCLSCKYSQADMAKLPTHESFTLVILH